MVRVGTKSPQTPSGANDGVDVAEASSCVGYDREMQNKDTLTKCTDPYTFGTSEQDEVQVTAKPLEKAVAKERANATEQQEKAKDLQSPQASLDHQGTCDLTFRSGQESVANPAVRGTEVEEQEKGREEDSGGGESKSVRKRHEEDVDSQPTDCLNTRQSVAIGVDLIPEPGTSPPVVNTNTLTYEQKSKYRAKTKAIISKGAAERNPFGEEAADTKSTTSGPLEIARTEEIAEAPRMMAQELRANIESLMSQ